MNLEAGAPDPRPTETLLSIEAACGRAARHALAIRDIETVPLRGAGGRVLAERVLATVALPIFDQSAMDGYALHVGDAPLASGTRLPVRGRIAAGDRDGASALAPDTATRILTGAPVPQGANAVVMQEHGWRDQDNFVLTRTANRGDNIRRRGEDIAEGDVLLSGGERLDARHVALLAAQGSSTVAVRRRPRVAILSTGNELRQAGAILSPAAIYDSNGPMLQALADEASLTVVDVGCVRDDPRDLARTLTTLASRCDLIVTTGGASVGEEDHAADAMLLAGGDVEELRIAMKPGKPAIVGRLGGCAYLALPGNPVSALVSWLFLGGAVVAALEGRPYRRPVGCPMRVRTRFDHRPGRTEFAPARIVAGQRRPEVELLGRGGSARLRPLVLADGLAEIGPLHVPVEPGDTILFHPFRGGFAM